MMNFHKNVAVIGAGIIGLPTAYKILQDFPSCKVTVFAKSFTPDTTADISAGFIFPYACGGDPVEIRRWFKQTVERLAGLYKRPDAIEIGISPISGYVLGTDIDTRSWNGVFPNYRKFSCGEKEMFLNCQEAGYHLTTWTCLCSRYLPWLMKQFKELGGEVVHQNVENFDQLLDYDITVNCCGIETKKLLDDDKLVPDRGQVIVVKAPWIKHFTLIGDDYYVLPRLEDVVVGGTHRLGNYSLDPCLEDTERIFQVCCKYEPSLRYSKRLGVNVGLRPRRESIRLEVEERKINGQKTQIVLHNYGHGGSGVTLHWGCAIEASNLLRKYLQMNFKL